MSKLETNTIDTVSGTSTLQVGSTNTTTITLGASGDTINIPSGATIANSGTATGFGGGKIGQVVSGTLTSSFATTSTSFVATGLDVDITPSATSSKVFVIATCYLDDNSSAHQVYSTLYRDSTNLGDSTKGMMSSYSAPGRLRSNHTMSFLDSPSSTSALNYEVFVKGDGNTISFNSESAIVSITAMEVLA